MNSLLLLTICALVAAPIYAQESQAVEKKVEKRGVLGLGYGGLGGLGGVSGLGGLGGLGGAVGYGGVAGYGGLATGYGGYGNGLVSAAVPAYSAPVVSSVVAPLAPVAPYVPSIRVRGGYGYNAGYNGIGLGNNLGYLHG